MIKSQLRRGKGSATLASWEIAHADAGGGDRSAVSWLPRYVWALTAYKVSNQLTIFPAGGVNLAPGFDEGEALRGGRGGLLELRPTASSTAAAEG